MEKIKRDIIIENVSLNFREKLNKGEFFYCSILDF